MRVNDESDLGACGNVVVILALIIPRNQNYKLYFVNYYTTQNLLAYLTNGGIYSLGSMWRNRITDCKLPNEQDMKKKVRQFGASSDNINISCLIWEDKLVTLVSTIAVPQPESTVKWYDKSSKSFKEVKCPDVIKEYNKHKDGVDLLHA